MENKIWENYENNTNTAEATHAQANRKEKQLKLIKAIMRGERLDERLFKVAEVHNRFSVPYTRRDKSKIKQKSITISRKKKTVMSEIISQEKPRTKRKLTTTIDDNIEIEERKMQLAEKQTANRRALAEVVKLELENIKLRKELEN
ncbi:hypothetical protein C1646_764393 [Rhizophagus diaphanus]|nr:hypothetical protein C1646_764393 [Rhizophagus diaphanus] [Rhizophagus sp. MUCL 43196]